MIFAKNNINVQKFANNFFFQGEVNPWPYEAPTNENRLSRVSEQDSITENKIQNERGTISFSIITHLTCIFSIGSAKNSVAPIHFGADHF